MNFSELLERVATWENLHTEFKRWPLPADDLAPSLVAFANTDGGQLVLGISEDRTLLGVEDSDKVATFVDNVAANNCEPPITVVQEVLRDPTQVGSKMVVVVNIPKGDMRPYRTNRGTYYVRTSSGRRHASREELLRLFQATESLWYDETPLLRSSTDDLDLAALDNYLSTTHQEDLRGEPERLLENWGLLNKGHATLAGLVMFGREPQRHLPYAQINAARFPGTDDSTEPADRKDLQGRLLEILNQAERFVDLHLAVPHTIRGFRPEPCPEMPKEVFREAIVNAVAHRDYTIRGPVRLFIFDDRVEVRTPGAPPNSVDEGAMRAGVHVVRNPRIYARLSDAGLVTRAGTGVRRMARLIAEATGGRLGITIAESQVIMSVPRRTWSPDRAT